MCELRTGIVSGLRDLYVRCNHSFCNLITTMDVQLAVGCADSEKNQEAQRSKNLKLGKMSGPETERIEILSKYFEKNMLANNSSILSAEHTSANLLQSFRGGKAGFNASYYVKRISKYSGSGSYCFIIAKIYLERLQKRYPSVVITSRTLQRLLLVAVMTATKYLEDCTFLNTRW